MRWGLIAAVFSALGCGGGGPTVVVYTALDQPLSEPILALFEARSGIDVQPLYDTEATKTTGLVNRLIAEADRPRCDVFWNNEIVQTLRLVNRGLTQPYRSPSAETIPTALRDPEGHWTGFAARARVIVEGRGPSVEGQVVPTDYTEIFEGAGAAQSGLALPLFGTTATHLAALFTEWGPARTEAWLREIRDGPAQVLDSNSQVCDAVARGALRRGWTDTDDVAVAQAEGRDIVAVFPTSGAILIPNTVALMAGAPHPEAGRALIDFLLSPEVEQRLAEGPGRQIPLHPGVPVPDGGWRLEDLAIQEIDWNAVAANFDAATALAHRILVEGG